MQFSQPTQKLSSSDTPFLYLVSPAGENTYKFHATFTDTLMFTTWGGIWVPLGNFKWSIDMEAVADVTQPSGWRLVDGAAINVTQEYHETGAYPTWQMSEKTFTDTYGSFWAETA